MTRQQNINKLDQLCSDWCRSLGRCEVGEALGEWCSTYLPLQTHHLSKRGHLLNRFKESNLVCICAYHHQKCEDKAYNGMVAGLIRTEEQLRDIFEDHNEIYKGDFEEFFEEWKDKPSRGE